jgi:hypothetical protein
MNVLFTVPPPWTIRLAFWMVVDVAVPPEDTSSAVLHILPVSDVSKTVA